MSSNSVNTTATSSSPSTAALVRKFDSYLPSRLKLRRHQALYWSTILFQAQLPKMRGSVIVLGFIGSGTNWMCNVLQHYLDLPGFEAWHRFTPSISPHVFHLHRFVETGPARERTIYMYRDGRDAVTSAYHKVVNAPPEDNRRRRFEAASGITMDPDRIREQMPVFLEWFTKTPQRAAMPWPEHVRRALDADYPLASFEEMKRDPEAMLTPIVERLTGAPVDPARLKAAIESQQFDRLQRPENAHFYRRGTVGDWGSSFNRRAREIFADWAGAELIALGYETDDSWVSAAED